MRRMGKNFDLIDVGKCTFSAFHPKNRYRIRYHIEPKMRFGTGHHETTCDDSAFLEIDVTGMKTLDMGCGTAILAILAEMKGAQLIDAIDIDNWCF
jgi:ribosomal protein L11 methyltransferase